MSILQEELKRYRPALALDRMLSPELRRGIRYAFSAVALILGAVVLGYVMLDFIETGTLTFDVMFTDARIPAGLFFILIAPVASLYLLSFYYNTRYFRGVNAFMKEDAPDGGGITYEVADILSTDPEDLTYGFLVSNYGMHAMLRCGVTGTEVAEFLNGARDEVTIDVVHIPEGQYMTLDHVAGYLCRKDRSFGEFLQTHGVAEETFLGAVHWVDELVHDAKYEKRWWSRDHLGKIRGVGTELSYGVAYRLKKYLRDIGSLAVFARYARTDSYARDTVERMEMNLARSNAANVMLIGEPGVGKMDTVIALAKKAAAGKSVAAIERRHFMVFDAEAFVASHNSKEAFEAAFLSLMAEAMRAGNILIIMNNIHAFIRSVDALGVDAGELMDRFLSSSDLQFIATTDPASYHAVIERHPQFLSQFATIQIEHATLVSTIAVLKDAALTHEARFGFVFTYSAVSAIAENADRYIMDGVMPEKAVTLLSEVATAARQEKLELVTREFVEAYVSRKTGIPSGHVTENERDMLLNLEAILHERVVGQDQAITAIASAMRRSRAGIEDRDRPIGSFLFLGSTGVGKTETAKALAEVFFGNEEKMLRLDMSEYSGGDALARLIGEQGHSGALSDMLTDQPYGVLLLDEFEKASGEVHNLFLQILEEGFFTDARGTRINARNTIIIATSNAGSDLIWEMTKDGAELDGMEDRVVDEIISRGTFKPELVNRFDAAVLFDTLSLEDQEKVARLMLRELQERIKDRGYELVIDDVLVNILVTKGYDPQFGARPMRRVMQDVIEEKIARKIIEGGLKPGDKIWFYAEDFEDEK